ncbi:SsgA family sporulation/cell division regulator [Streptomyces sp. NPDC006527]|uniref:SsgA family sporulation/cell division regulator n=1 Tax=Streptomyces sp. NPDC006527 TaxID=3364749 RepID=UPI003693088C
MRLHYTADDPYALRAAFHAEGHDTTVEWVFGREVLAEGLTRHAGHGDVRVWPVMGRGREVLRIGLSSNAGSALLEASLQDMKSFLRQTQSLVPLGAESEQLDIDTELAHFLAES